MKKRKRKLIINKILFLLILTLLSSCGFNNENEELKVKFIESVKKYSNSKDTLVLKSLTNFKWNNFVLVEEDYDEKDIENIIGFYESCSVVPKGHIRYLFWESVSQTTQYFDLSYINSGICYNCSEFNVLSPKKAMFLPAREYDNENVNYWLNPLFCE